MPPLLRVVERERGIGDDAVEAHQLATVGVERLGERVPVADIRVGDAVEEEIHLRDGPDPAVVLLAEQGEVPRVAAVLLDVFLREDEHAAEPEQGS